MCTRQGCRVALLGFTHLLAGWATLVDELGPVSRYFRAETDLNKRHVCFHRALQNDSLKVIRRENAAAVDWHSNQACFVLWKLKATAIECF